MARRWSKKQIDGLICRLMNSEVWDVVSHRSFRQHLTLNQNRFINGSVRKANFGDPVKALSEVDVMSISDEEFFNMVDEVGGDVIWDDVFRRISSEG
jgi:hypothetical protein